MFIALFTALSSLHAVATFADNVFLRKDAKRQEECVAGHIYLFICIPAVSDTIFPFLSYNHENTGIAARNASHIGPELVAVLCSCA